MGTKGQNNRARIIEAADQLFHKRGYNQTSFSDIADITGIPRGNFYYYFKTKDDILAAVVDARVDQYREALTNCENISDDPRERLHAFIDIIASNEASLLDAGCPIGSLCAELAKDTDALRSKSREVFEFLREWLGQQFADLGFSDGDDKAMDMLARMQGVAMMACTFKDDSYLKKSITQLRTWVNSLTLN